MRLKKESIVERGYLTAREAAELFRTNPTQIYRMVSSGKLRGERVTEGTNKPSLRIPIEEALATWTQMVDPRMLEQIAVVSVGMLLPNETVQPLWRKSAGRPSALSHPKLWPTELQSFFSD